MTTTMTTMTTLAPPTHELERQLRSLSGMARRCWPETRRPSATTLAYTEFLELLAADLQGRNVGVQVDTVQAFEVQHNSVESCAKGPLTRWCRAVARREEAQALVKTFGDLLRREHLHPGSRQLQGKWDPIEPPTDFHSTASFSPLGRVGSRGGTEATTNSWSSPDPLVLGSDPDVCIVNRIR